MSNKDRIKISYILNIIIVFLVVLASIIMFAGINYMHAEDPVYEANKFFMMKYFTVDSNMLMGIASLVFLIEERKLLKDSRKSINPSFYIFKLVATVSVSLTFLTVFLYLGPGSSGGIASMLTNSNLFFHLIIPVLSIISFVYFERTNKIDKKYIKYGLIPTLIYAIFYISNVLIHVENFEVSTKYDWYWFVQNGLWTALIVVPLMILFTYLISYTLYLLNHKRGK